MLAKLLDRFVWFKTTNIYFLISISDLIMFFVIQNLKLGSLKVIFVPEINQKFNGLKKGGGAVIYMFPTLSIRGLY